MIHIVCSNAKKERFEKVFESPYLAKKFMEKAKRGKKITFVGYWEDK